jgi:pSer/pThr/pTyr-binding forkhead associated (FHA) protein
MGRILKNEKEICLFRDHIFGRDLRCSSVLKGNAVSRFHARISWNGENWCLRDLGSRNGTYLNGRLLLSEGVSYLTPGDVILFGDFEEEFLFSEKSPPESCLVSVDHDGSEVKVSLTHLLPLPSIERPVATIFAGKLGDFYLETEFGEILPLQHAVPFSVENKTYTPFFENPPDESPQTDTSEMTGSDSAYNTFIEILVSPDEESAEVRFHKGNEVFSLNHKAHFYLLAYLGRKRIEETKAIQNTLSKNKDDDNGWVDCELICKELMMNRDHLGQQVFRIRQEFKPIDSLIAEKIIDRDLRGKMRIGLSASKIQINTIK